MDYAQQSLLLHIANVMDIFSDVADVFLDCTEYDPISKSAYRSHQSYRLMVPTFGHFATQHRTMTCSL